MEELDGFDKEMAEKELARSNPDKGLTAMILAALGIVIWITMLDVIQESVSDGHMPIQFRFPGRGVKTWHLGNMRFDNKLVRFPGRGVKTWHLGNMRFDNKLVRRYIQPRRLAYSNTCNMPHLVRGRQYKSDHRS